MVPKRRDQHVREASDRLPTMESRSISVAFDQKADTERYRLHGRQMVSGEQDPRAKITDNSKSRARTGQPGKLGVSVSGASGHTGRLLDYSVGHLMLRMQTIKYLRKAVRASSSGIRIVINPSILESEPYCSFQLVLHNLCKSIHFPSLASS